MAYQTQLIRKVGRAVHEFDMIRAGDSIAVGVSGGKDSLALLGALQALQKRAPVPFDLQAFTIEQGKFVRPIEPLGEYMRQIGVRWTYYRDQASFDLIEEQPRSRGSRLLPACVPSRPALSANRFATFSTQPSKAIRTLWRISSRQWAASKRAVCSTAALSAVSPPWTIPAPCPIALRT